MSRAKDIEHAEACLARFQTHDAGRVAGVEAERARVREALLAAFDDYNFVSIAAVEAIQAIAARLGITLEGDNG